MDRIDQITQVLNGFFTPLAILSLTIIALAYVISPAAQEWMMQNRGMMGRVLFGLVLFPAITSLVALLT
jgi:uncharacterized membrane protein